MDHQQRLKLEQDLQFGLQCLDLKLSAETQRKLIDFLVLLRKWNKAYNLTAIDDLSEMLVLHIFDSLAIAPYIIGPNVLDVGTGAGLPGVPLALVFPDYHFVLLDSNRKKTTFLNQVVLELGIKNVTVVWERVEKFKWTTCFATIVSRATTSISFIMEKAGHLCCNGGQILMMKGKCPQTEGEVRRIQVPKLNAERHLERIFVTH